MAGSRLDGLRAAATAIALLVAIPVAVVFSSWLAPATDIWRHFAAYVLGDLLRNTFWLALGVGLGTLLVGVSLAWLTTMCEFPGRRVFAWALMLPLALPTYVLAFVSRGLFDYTGPVQTALRSWSGAADLWFPRIQSTGGVITVLTLALYPYVYLITRNAFRTQGVRMMEVAQSLGHGHVSGFFRVALPMARPWIAGGLALVLMETLADFGAVAIFNYDTFTTAIYKAWYSLFSLPAAAQLASMLLLIVLALVLTEAVLRPRRRYHTARPGAPGRRIVLSRRLAAFAFFYCAAILALAFVLPMGQLLLWAYEVLPHDLDGRYLDFLGHTLTLALAAAALTAAAALILVYAVRHNSGGAMRAVTRVATLGYAVPGAVLAVGIFIPVAWLDNQLILLARGLFARDVGLLIQGTILIMLLAYVSRFLAVAHNPIEAAMHRVAPHIDEAARGLGLGRLATVWRVHLPMLRGGLFTAVILVFVEVMKEMPITLMLRPFGWDTLAVRIFEMTSEGEWRRAALPAVALVLAGLIPIALLLRRADRT